MAGSLGQLAVYCVVVGLIIVCVADYWLALLWAGNIGLG
jgi:hypothetical protein